LQRNIDRDDYVTATLHAAGWTVLRFWESEIADDINKTARRIESTVRRLRGRSRVGDRRGVPKRRRGRPG
jgi:very-short-patch-repair endonuclease